MDYNLQVGLILHLCDQLLQVCGFEMKSALSEMNHTKPDRFRQHHSVYTLQEAKLLMDDSGYMFWLKLIFNDIKCTESRADVLIVI